MKRLLLLILAALLLLGGVDAIRRQQDRRRAVAAAIAVERAERARLLAEIVVARTEHECLTRGLADLYLIEVTKRRIESRGLRIYLGNDGPNPEMTVNGR